MSFRIFLCITFLLFVSFFFVVRADELDDINHQLDDTKRLLTDIQKATQVNESNLASLRKQLDAIKSRVFAVEGEIEKKETQVKKGEEALSHQRDLLNGRAYSYYKNIGKNTASLMQLLAASDFSSSVQNFFYQKALIDQDKRSIIQIVLYIKDLEDKKNALQKEKDRLAEIKIAVDKQSAFLATEVEKSKKYESELEQKIASLTARQQNILAQKLAGLNISRSASSMGRCDSDLTNGRDPGFSPRFGFFTFGVPNRVGLNQYGAWGRAKANKNEEEILKAYYTFDEIKKWDTNITINVDGVGSYTLEEYMKRVYEIPDSWTDNNLAALKAQAIAARSYVLAYTRNGQGSICATESCQVAKADPKGGNWERAVQETEGKVMVQGGNPIKAWFSSTHGGYVFSSAEIGWSSTGWTKHATDFSGSVNSFEDLKNNAYDKDSPWFYCDWGSRTEFNKTAWLKSDELADIVNAIMLAKRDSTVQDHLSQPDKPNPDGVETWDQARVRSELSSRGAKPFTSVSSVSVSFDAGAGRSGSVSVSGDGDPQTFDGGEFKNFFNLRAPANIQIVGPLYNVEKR